MLQRLLALILLLSHVNFSMFIAQVDEIDTYDKKGRQQEDVNSIIQYAELVFHIKHKPLPDTDDDNARYFQIGATQLYDFHQYKIKTSSEDFAENKTEYSAFKESKWLSPVIEITSPPPKA